jgi:magnesium chelatase subunit I
MEQEATRIPGSIKVRTPRYIEEILAHFTSELRASSQVNQRSGVSVRFSIGNLETVAASALRRAVRTGEPQAVPRVVDLWAVIGGSTGRIEFDALEEGREEEILRRALRKAIVTVWQRRLSGENLENLTSHFEEGLEIETSDVMSAAELLGQFEEGGRSIESLVSLNRLLERLDVVEESPVAAASAVEMCLEGLYLNRRVSKYEEDVPGRFRFSSEG